MARQVVIRLQRNRVFKKPQYKIIAIFKDTKTYGAPLDILGVYNPNIQNKMFFINVERLSYWAHKGAIVSDRVVKLLGVFFSAVFYTKKFVTKAQQEKKKRIIKKPKQQVSTSKEITALLKNQAGYERHVKFARKFWARKRSKLVVNNKSTFNK